VRESALGTDSLCRLFKRIAVLAFLICGMFLLLGAPAKAQISPGPLSAGAATGAGRQLHSDRDFHEEWKETGWRFGWVQARQGGRPGDQNGNVWGGN
jgi:hypothetical protein